METRNVILGLEFSENSSRLCVYDRNTREVVSLRLWDDEESFPTVLAWSGEKNCWFVGEEAACCRNEASVLVLDRLFEIVSGRKNTEIDRSYYTPAELMAEFLRGVLRKTGIERPEKQLSAIMLTCPKLSRNLVENIRSAYELLGIPRGKAYLEEHDESFYYHTISQKPELWARSVGCFCVEPDEARFLRLTVSAKTKPTTARVELIGRQKLSPNPEVRDREFLELIRTSLGSEIYSSVFLTGDGFAQEWATESVRELFRRRIRLFGGENLFAAGACYAAREKVDERNPRGILFLGNDLVRSSISMELIVNGSKTNFVLLNPGIHWYEAERECELLLEDTTKLEFIATQMETGKIRHFVMNLDGIPSRPPRTSRILLKLEYQSPTELLITAEDLGFGEIFPASGKIWTETLEEVQKKQ